MDDNLTMAINAMRSNPLVGPPMRYPWQIYPMRWLSNLWVDHWSCLSVTIRVYLEKSFFDCVVHNYAPYVVPSSQESLERECFYQAQETVYASIVASSPIQGCSLPPSTEYKPCRCGADGVVYDE